MNTSTSNRRFRWVNAFSIGVFLAGIGVLICLSVVVAIIARVADIPDWQAADASLTGRVLLGLALVGMGFAILAVVFRRAAGATWMVDVGPDVSHDSPRELNQPTNAIRPDSATDKNRPFENGSNVGQPANTTPNEKMAASAATTTEPATQAVGVQTSANSSDDNVVHCRACSEANDRRDRLCKKCGETL